VRELSPVDVPGAAGHGALGHHVVPRLYNSVVRLYNSVV